MLAVFSDWLVALYRPLSFGSYFVSGDLKSFVYAQSFFSHLRQNGYRVTKVYRTSFLPNPPRALWFFSSFTLRPEVF